MKLNGIPASPGISFAKAFVLNEDEIKIIKKTIDDPHQEISRLSNAINDAKVEIEKLKEIALEKLGHEKSLIFEAHLMLLEDPEYIDQVKAKISDERNNAEFAFHEVSNQFISMFESMDDEYLKERAHDIKDISSRVIRHLLGIKEQDLSLLKEQCILIAHDLTPSQTSTLKKEMVLGFLTNIGGKTSHSAIMARSMEIPAILGFGNITQKIKDGEWLAIDGATGEVFITPDDSILAALKDKKLKEEKEKELLLEYYGKKSETLDGFHIELAGNIGSSNDLDSLHKNDAEAIGLFRTEFVFMDRETMPSEEEQFEYYSKVLKGFNKKCIIRTLDIGGDKKLDYLDIGNEMNPFLGYRAIRICLNDQELFKTQLRALYRASIFGNLWIMFPMISSLEEVLAVKKIIADVKTELKERGIAFSNDVKLGIMIEIPSAALISDVLAKHVDFMSIGTNDLTQYTCAVDRMNEKISHLYNPFSPGLLRLIYMTVRNARENNIEIGICGSMAHQKELVPLFIGMGLTELSMSSMHILPTRKLVRSLESKKCKDILLKVMTLGTAHEIEETLKKL